MLYLDRDRSSQNYYQIKHHTFSFAERIIYWTAILTPVWWLLGIQQLFYPLVMAGLLALVFDVSKLFRIDLPTAVWAWLAMSLIMLWTAFLGINSGGFELPSVAAALVTFIKSYFLIFACLALPFFSTIRVQVVTRAVSWMSVGMLGNMILQMGLLIVGVNDLKLTPPAAMLLPGEPPASMLIQSPLLSDFFNIPFPRTVLHTADPPILGVCGLLCFIICLAETDPRLRRLALTGSLGSLIISFSRSSWVGLPIFFLIFYLFRSKLATQLSLWAGTITFLLCTWLELTVKELLQTPSQLFNDARASSSETRDLVVEATLKAWQEKPWLGWGIISGKAWLYEDEYITLGSFSTYAAVLYLNGIIGFIIFITALILTLFFFYEPAIKGNILCQRAFASLVVFYLLIQATPLSWMAIYLWFFFVWLGAIMKTIKEQTPVISNWQQLSIKDKLRS
ncbi:MAG: O-antigen ligase family protein [Pleurocapsa sp.]